MATQDRFLLRRAASIIEMGSGDNLAICRDEYLKKLFEFYPFQDGEMFGPSGYQKEVKDETDKEESQVEITKEFQPEKLTQAELEALLGRPIEGSDFVFFKQCKKRIKIDYIRLKSISMEQNEINTEKYYNLIAQSAVYMSMFKLLKRILVVYTNWPGDIAILPFSLFSWSLDSLTFRAELPNLIHIDVVDMEIDRTELDNIKFKMDLYEIMDNINMIYENSLDYNYMYRKLDELQQAANFESTFAIPFQNLNSTRKSLTGQLFRLKHGNARYAGKNEKLELDALLNEVSAIEPIKNRYAFNSLANDVDIAQHKNNLDIKKISDEIEYYKQLAVKNEFTFRCSQNMYYVIIEDLKIRINELTIKYDIDIENAENMVNITKNDLGKAYDNLKYFREQVEMFKIRTEEVLAQIAKEEAERIWRLENPPPVPEKIGKEKKKKKKKKGKK